MASLLLDTSVLVGSMRSGLPPDGIDDDDTTAITALTLAELIAGALLTRGHDRTINQRFIRTVMTVFPLVPYTPKIAISHGRLLATTRAQGRPRGQHDLIIAATAQATDRIVVTADHGFADLPGVEVRLVGQG